MNEATSPGPVSLASAPEATFRMLTPVYNYRIEGADCFKHSGTNGSLKFNLDLRPHPSPTDWVAVAECAKPSIREEIERRATHDSQRFGTPADHFLRNDVVGPGSVGEPAWNTQHSIHLAVVYGLRLHASAGLQHHETYSYWLPPATLRGLSYNLYNFPQYPFSYLSRPSILQDAEFDACRCTIDVLMRRVWSSTTHDRMLLLAMEYQRISFTLERVEHAFLILMVAYEAMFKKDATENATHPAVRIGRLLGAATQKDCSAIQKEFNDDPDSFSKIRNRIAHGDPSLNLATVAGKYLSLYRHVTAAIVNLLNLPYGALDSTTDYYGALSRYTKARYDGLPRS